MEHISPIKFKCVRCGTCCCDINTIVNLTFRDILRIKKGLKLTDNELLEVLGFYISEDSFSEEIIKRMVITPIKTERGLSFVGLKKDSNGKCTFYDSTKKKCRIYSIRPNFCRTFPFSFIIENNELKTGKVRILITEKGKQYCIGINEKSPEIDLKYWMDLGMEVLIDLKQNMEFSEKWNKNAKTPTAKKYIDSLNG